MGLSKHDSHSGDGAIQLRKVKLGHKTNVHMTYMKTKILCISIDEYASDMTISVRGFLAAIVTRADISQ